jgi:mRNA-degrading endonuclease RelE of RelBE toxin-antitoxin system
MRGAESDVAKADGSLRIAIVAGLEKLQVSPAFRGLPLSGNLHGWRKLVVGSRNLRIIFRYQAETDEVFVLAIAARKDSHVYRLANQRLIQRE